MFLSKDEIVNDVMSIIDEESKAELRIMAKEDLIVFHHTTGRSIRNHYKLWEPDNPLTMLNYEPQLENGVDVNPKHPDSVSMDIIEEVWSRIQIDG